MKITNEDIKNWFPRDNRFLHFCAKYYGLTFHNSDVVEHAAYLAFLNVKRYMDRDQEFENEKEKTGMVMSAFRFAILNSYRNYQSANRRNLDMRNESEVTYGDNDDEISLYQRALISHDKAYDNTLQTLKEFVDVNLPYLEKKVIQECYFNDKGFKELADDLQVSIRKIELAKYRAFTKIKNYLTTEDENEKRRAGVTTKSSYISESRSQLRAKILSEPIRKKQVREDSYTEAMSFIHSSPKI